VLWHGCESAQIHLFNRERNLSLAGRPSDVALVDEAFRERRTRKLPLVKQSTESGKIRAEIALHHPERDLPALKTIERHLSRMSKAKSG
jgi:hypothetical protein